MKHQQYNKNERKFAGRSFKKETLTQTFLCIPRLTNDFYFRFPSKSAIILGDEKEGIPAHLFPSLDVCVEIPQVGVVRSLNVHVSAALTVWEYFKQHTFAR